MKKIVFLDVDGTISSTGKGISDKVKYAMKKARQQGHYVFLCTGRNKAGVRLIEHDLYDGIICSAGGYIEINDRIIYCEYLSQEEVKELRNVLDELRALYNIEGTNETYAHDDLDKYIILSTLKHEISNSELNRLILNAKDEFETISLSEFDQNPVDVHKICFVVKERNHLDIIHQKFDEQYHVVVHASSKDSIINGEFIKRTLSKGKAIKKVIEHLGLSIEDTIGFGDSMNDYDMIKTCYQGIAMENACEELKQYASKICESVEQDGVYHEFIRLGLIHE